jgi:glycosyltransferase involved in cell wall biosynthesis
MIKGLLTLPIQDPDANVLVVTSGWPYPGNPVYCVFIKRQVDSLRRAGVRCDVVFINGSRFAAFAYPLAALRLAAWNLLRPKRYRIVHAQTGEAALAASFFRRAPLLVTYYGSDLLGTRRVDGSIALSNRLKIALLRQHARLARQTITQSSEMETKLPGSARRRNAVIPSGVDPALFRPIDRDEARRLLGWPTGERVALFLGRAAAVKRYWVAEAACAVASRQLPNLRLHVASKVPPEDVPLLLNAADCLLFTSSSEGSPNAVKEAVMCNLPVIATSVGDVREVLREIEPSFVCGESEEELADALVACLAEPRRSNGRVVAERRIADHAVAETILAVYGELTRPKGGGRCPVAC